jgi:hypothetical protein
MRTLPTPTIPGLAAVLAIPAIAMLAMVTPAAAKPATYVGVWGETPGQCRKTGPMSGDNSPVRFTAKGYDQWEQHCNFRSVRAVGAGWIIQAKCFATGTRPFTDTATIWTAPRRLTVKWATERTKLNYLRCR